MGRRRSNLSSGTIALQLKVTRFDSSMVCGRTYDMGGGGGEGDATQSS